MEGESPATPTLSKFQFSFKLCFIIFSFGDTPPHPLGISSGLQWGGYEFFFSGAAGHKIKLLRGIREVIKRVGEWGEMKIPGVLFLS